MAKNLLQTCLDFIGEMHNTVFTATKLFIIIQSSILYCWIFQHVVIYPLFNPKKDHQFQKRIMLFSGWRAKNDLKIPLAPVKKYAGGLIENHYLQINHLTVQ
jgi:hypothetical protein